MTTDNFLDIEEVTIGNYVTRYNYVFPLEIEIGDIENFNGLFPLKIDADRLKKLGFKQRENSIIWVKRDVRIVFSEGLGIKTPGIDSKIFLPYVHQLQNLYRLLRGDSLELIKGEKLEDF